MSSSLIYSGRVSNEYVLCARDMFAITLQLSQMKSAVC